MSATDAVAPDSRLYRSTFPAAARSASPFASAVISAEIGLVYVAAVSAFDALISI